MITPPPPSVASGLSTGIYFVLRSYLLYLCSEQRAVEILMENLSEQYRESMPRTRLLLVPRRYVKGGPVSFLHWARLTKWNPLLDDAQLRLLPRKRRRWWKHLNLRTRREIHNEVYFSGLTSVEETVLGFHERAKSLNQARRFLAVRLRNMARIFRSGLSATGDWSSFELGLTGEDPVHSWFMGSGPRLLDLGWHVEQSMSVALEELNHLLKLGDSEEITLETLPDWRSLRQQRLWREGEIGWFWRDGREGGRHDQLKDFLLQKLDDRVEDNVISQADGIIALRLQERLDRLLLSVRRAVRRFRDIQQGYLPARARIESLGNSPYCDLLDAEAPLPLDRLTASRDTWPYGSPGVPLALASLPDRNGRKASP